MQKFEPIKLDPGERIELASVQKHPGVAGVLIGKILEGHVNQALLKIYEVEPDDPDRTVKIEAISAVAYAMKLSRDLVKRELDRNWKIVMDEEEKRKKAAQKASEANKQ